MVTKMTCSVITIQVGRQPTVPSPQLIHLHCTPPPLKKKIATHSAPHNTTSHNSTHLEAIVKIAPVKIVASSSKRKTPPAF